MVAPLDIQRVILHQLIHDQVRTGAAVINISQYVQMVNDQALDQLTESSYKLLRPAHPYNRGDNGGVIGFFVSDICLFRHQLFNDIGKFRRQRLAHLRTGVFAARTLADLYKTVKSNLIPVLLICRVL